MAAEDGRSEKEILAQFNDMRARLNNTWTKVMELSADAIEHDTVIAALRPMESERRCFRLVGQVLVERTVGETLPAVVKNKEGLDAAVATLQEAMTRQKDELSAYQKKYKIKIRSDDKVGDEEGDEEEAAGPSSKAATMTPKAPQGVLEKSL